jgi:hypothetical protein
MATLNVSDRMKQLVDEIFSKGKTIHGRPIAGKELVVVQGDEHSGRILVPYWFSIWEHGRGRGKSTKTNWENTGFYNRKGEPIRLSTFQKAIYEWMGKYGLFESRTDKGKIYEAKYLAMYINKYGNKHKRNGTYLDIYTSLTTKLVNDITKDVADFALKITSDLIKV